MTLAELDDTLLRLRRAADAISTNLVELDADPNRKLLDGAALAGESGEQWADASQALANMWVLLTRFTALLDQATEVRGTRARLPAPQEERLEALLTGPSIELERAAIPLPVRTVTGDREAETRCTPDDLVRAISDSFERVKSVVFGIGAVWDTLIPRLRAAQQSLAEAVDAARALGDAPDADLTRLETTLDDLGDTIALDPLAASPTELEVVEQDVARLRQTTVAATALRDDLGRRLDDARTLLARVRDTAADASAAHREVLDKITDPTVPEPEPVGREIRAGFEHVEALTTEGRWRAADDALDEWTVRATAALAELEACTVANRAPIEERNELRGRLDAYRAMAHARGLLEDPIAGARYDDAHDVLYTAPTDLAEAARLVSVYRTALTGDTSNRRGPR
jgi:hypothetical protein